MANTLKYCNDYTLVITINMSGTFIFGIEAILAICRWRFIKILVIFILAGVPATLLYVHDRLAHLSCHIVPWQCRWRERLTAFDFGNGQLNCRWSVANTLSAHQARLVRSVLIEVHWLLYDIVKWVLTLCVCWLGVGVFSWICRLDLCCTFQIAHHIDFQAFMWTAFLLVLIAHGNAQLLWVIWIKDGFWGRIDLIFIVSVIITNGIGMALGRCTVTRCC